ncbi:MAG: hypothetical protein GTO13_21765 [Proteobacteria bacterium]|nr:hypothetical protein [Pseudomonadota bacterium]
MANKTRKKHVILNDAVLFDLIIMSFFLLLAVVSLDYNPRARSIPLALGIVGSVMMFMQFLVDALPSVRSKLRFISQSGLLADQDQFRPRGLVTPGPEVITDSDQTPPPSREAEKSIVVEWWRVLRVTLWLVGFIVLLGFTYYLIAVGAFVIAVTKFEAKESWKRSITLGICVVVAFYLLFNVILKVHV